MRRTFPPLAALVPLAAVALVLLAAAGCGLRPDDQPQGISRDQLDPTLFQERPQASTGSGSTRIFVLSSQGRDLRLTPIPVQADPGDRSRSVLESLLAWSPPSDGPYARLSSLIPHGTDLRDVRRDGSLLTVDLANFTVEGPGQTAAVAQIVYTATDVPGVTSVRLLLDGKPVPVPLDDKSSAPGARLARSDFPAFEPEPPPTTTTSAPGTTVGTAARSGA